MYITKQADSKIQRTGGYQWGEGRVEGQAMDRRLRNTNYYV